MKKLTAVLALALALALALPWAVLATMDGVNLSEGDAFNIDGIGQVTVLPWAMDDYAASIAFIERGEELKTIYKYILDGHAVCAASADFKLLDLRLEVLNTSGGDVDLTEAIEATAVIDGQYIYLPVGAMEEIDSENGAPREYLAQLRPMSMFEKRTVHILFELPAIVETNNYTIDVSLKASGQSFNIVLQ